MHIPTLCIAPRGTHSMINNQTREFHLSVYISSLSSSPNPRIWPPSLQVPSAKTFKRLCIVVIISQNRRPTIDSEYDLNNWLCFPFNITNLDVMSSLGNLCSRKTNLEYEKEESRSCVYCLSLHARSHDWLYVKRAELKPTRTSLASAAATCRPNPEYACTEAKDVVTNLEIYP